MRQVLVAPAIVSGVQGMTHKEDSGWKENMQRISEMPIQTHHLQKDMVTVSQMRKRKQDRRLIID